MNGLSLSNPYGTGLRMGGGTGFQTTPALLQNFTTPTLSQMGQIRPMPSFNLGGMLGGLGQGMMNRPPVEPQWMQLQQSQMPVENLYDIIKRLYGGGYV